MDPALGDVVDRFLVFEERSDLVSERVEGVEAWPLIRSHLLLALVREQVELIVGHSSGSVPTLKGAYANARPRPALSLELVTRIPDARLGAVSSAGLRRKDPRSGVWVDTIYDRYKEILPELVLFEDPGPGGHRHPRVPGVYDLDLLHLLAEVSARASLPRRSKAIRYVRDVRHALEKDGLRVTGALEQSTARILVKALAIDPLWQRVLDRMRPSLMFVHCASYGGWRAMLCLRCHERGVVTAEVQHGVVNRYHGAYNYASRYPSKLRRYLPSFFLTYGSYWDSQLPRFPVQKVAVGCPEWEPLSRVEVDSNKQSSRGTVLVLSQPTITGMLVNFTEALLRHEPRSLQVVYRPHPLEVLPEALRKRLARHPQVLIDGERPLSAQLQQAHTVIGVYSTALFEAILAGIPVAVLDTPVSRAYLEGHPVHFVRDAEEVIALLESNPSEDSGDVGMLTLNCRENLLTFIRQNVAR
ncbi:hypothetical protein SY88_11500 [Clostridiales bacterium PH28_bin88]|nr:hypothetical protein SY88_11500 [Clostridiales bacterium PH28_bin88]